MFRIAFDPALPVVASTGFMAEGRNFVLGDPFDWREMGLSEDTLFGLWRSFMVHHPVPVDSVDVPEATIEMPGVADAGLAEKLASRELAARSKPTHKRR